MLNKRVYKQKQNLLNNKEEKIIIKENSKGITLVSLVVTIILLLLLSTISIQALTNQGLFEKTNMAELENKRGQITEWLSLKLYETQSENYNKTEEEIIELTRQNVEKNKSQLEKIGKNVNIDSEISTEEDGEQVGPYFYVVVDKDIYKVSMEEQKFIGEDGKLLPIIKLVSISNTSNSITVKLKTSRNEGGKLKYYIKEYDASDYTLVKELEDETYTYEGLKQGVKYSVKVVAENANKLTSEVVGEQTTGTVIDLKEGYLEFTSEPSTWTNTDVQVTVKSNIDTKGYQLQTSKDGEKWDNTTVQVFNTNGDIYARLWDGTNYGGSATGNVKNIDKTLPVIVDVISTDNSITFTAEDNESGIVGVKVTTTDIVPSEFSIVENTKKLNNKVISGLSRDTTYYVWVKDAAGNVNEVKSIKTKNILISNNINKVLSTTDNTELRDEKGNKIIVPAGFKIVVDNTTSNATTVDKGIVIEDATVDSTGKATGTNGSQFVWIPVGTITKADDKIVTIDLNRYSFDTNGNPTAQDENVIDKYFSETTSKGNTVAKDINAFKTSATTSGGYYMGRYEARNGLKINTIKGKPVETGMKQSQAAQYSRDMYSSNKFTSDLINSYAWDTAIVFIQNCGTNAKYSRQSTLNWGYAPTTFGTDVDIQCNVYDMASNLMEWTTETSNASDNPCVTRGGRFNYDGDTTSHRGTYSTDYGGNSITGFRPLLYINI